MKKKRSIYSRKLQLIRSSREAALAAIQIYNNPLIVFKTENYIVLMNIAWTYLLHAYYRSQKIEYRYFQTVKKRRKFEKLEGQYKYWELSRCLRYEKCPLDKDTKNNLYFLIGLRDQIVHKQAVELDTYLSGRYQACALNYNYYLKHLFGEKYGLDENLSYSIQFAELTFQQAESFADTKLSIPNSIKAYIAQFDNSLSQGEFDSDRYSYRINFTKKLAGKPGQADRVFEFIDPKSELAQNIAKEYWVKQEVERPKFLPSEVVKIAVDAGFKSFNIRQHALLWQAEDAKNPSKGYGIMVSKTWYWYQRWVDFVLSYLEKTAPETKMQA
ncbi:MAG: DUF3644 domain-containing protein [Planctomycetes bacterium]|nr:DUF3644 domain-containing protein [Planctomycetota bacterium]